MEVLGLQAAVVDEACWCDLMVIVLFLIGMVSQVSRNGDYTEEAREHHDL